MESGGKDNTKQTNELLLQGVPLKLTPLIFSKCQIWEEMAESQSRPPKIFLSVRFVNSAIFSKFSSQPHNFFLIVRFVNSTIV